MGGVLSADEQTWTAAPPAVSLSLTPGLPARLASAALFAAVLAMPAAVGFAVLKYRLYDIDRVISRTVAYAIITGLLAGIYAGLVLLSTAVFGLRTPVAVAAATLVAAALFSPVRRRVQVDRRFNRARYDGEATVAAFAARLKDAVDLEAVRDDLASVVQAALEPAHISIWTSQPDGPAATPPARLLATWRPRSVWMLPWPLGTLPPPALDTGRTGRIGRQRCPPPGDARLVRQQICASPKHAGSFRSRN